MNTIIIFVVRVVADLITSVAIVVMFWMIMDAFSKGTEDIMEEKRKQKERRK